LHFSQFMTRNKMNRASIRAVRFPGDLPAIEYLLDQTEGLRLIVIDPLSDFCPTPGLMAETMHCLNDLAAEPRPDRLHLIRLGPTRLGPSRLGPMQQSWSQRQRPKTTGHERLHR
jgi:hypothetical protein